MIRRDFCYVAGLATGSALVTSLVRAVDAFGMPNEDNHLQIATARAFDPSDIVLDISGYVTLADVDTDLNAGQTYYWRQTLFLNSQHALVYHGRLQGEQLWELIELYNSELIPFIQEVKDEPVPPLESGVICHIPPGNPRKAKTKEIDAADVDDHLGHGDHLGACDGTEGDESGGDRKGKGKKSGKNGEDIPSNYELGQNYPNPFTTFTTIPFEMPEATRARLTMYNLLGQQVGTMIDTETFVPGSVGTTPVARNDSYASLGNVGINVPSGSGLLANDDDPDGSGLAATPISAFDATSVNGGVVSVTMSDGSFTYTPPAGFEGLDAFSYTIDDGDGNFDGAEVLITVGDVIWFIDNTVGGAGGDGTLADPFKTVADHNTSADPAVGDDVYIAETGSNYTTGITLLDNQQLVGEGASGSHLHTVLGVTLPTHSNTLPSVGGTNPILTNGSGNGIDLGSGNTVRGLSIGNTSGNGIIGSIFGTLTVSDVVISGTGQAVNLDGGTLAATFTSISSTSSGSEGIDLNNVAGTFTVNGGSISGATGTAFRVNQGSASVFYSGSISNTSGNSVLISNKTGGTVTFSGAITDSGSGISLTSNSGATMNFSGGLDLDTGTSTGFSATGGGTVNVTGTNTINNTTGVGLNIANTTIGASGITFESISVSGASSGIILNNTGTAGGLTVTGDGIDNTLGGNDSGGILLNTTGTAIDLDVTSAFNIKSMRIQTPGGDGINALNISGSNSAKNITIDNVDGVNTSAIRIKNTSVSLADFFVEKSELTDAATGQTMFLVEGGGNIGLTMQVRVDGNLFSNLDPAAYQHTAGLIVGDNPTVSTFFTNNSVVDAKTGSVGTSEVNILKSHSGNSVFVVENNVFKNVGLFGVVNGILNVGGNGAMVGGTVTGLVKGNEFSDLPGKTNALRVLLEPATGSPGTIDITIDGNKFDDLIDVANDATAIHVEMRENVPTSHIRIINNSIGQGAIPGTTAGAIGGSRDGVFIEQDDAFANTMNLLMTGNSIHVTNTGTGTSGDQLVQINADDNGARINATIQGNVFDNSGTGDVAIRSDAATSFICLDLNAANTSGNSGNEPFVLVRDNGAVFEVEGTSGTDATVEAFLNARNTITIDAQGDGGGGFANSAACPVPPAPPSITPTMAEPVGLLYQVVTPFEPLTSAHSVSFDESTTKTTMTTSAGANKTSGGLPVDVSIDLGILNAAQIVTITFDAAIDDPFGGGSTEVCNQGTVSGTNFSTVLTDDPDLGGSSDPTCTSIDVVLPVELTEFDAFVDLANITLTWTTVSETNNAGFELEHACASCQNTLGLGSNSDASAAADGDGVAFEWTVLGFVDGHGSTTEPQTYVFTTEPLDPGRHSFRLKQIDLDGGFEYSFVVEATVEIPGKFVLEQAYPNPFNPTATIRFGVAVEQYASVQMYDMHGRMVRTLFNGTPESGVLHAIRIDGEGLASGAYVVRLETDGFSASRRIVLLK